MPFSRSNSIESMTRSATSSFARKAPDCQSMASTSVVFPWSTWATMATFRRSSRRAIEWTIRGLDSGRLYFKLAAGSASLDHPSELPRFTIVELLGGKTDLQDPRDVGRVPGNLLVAGVPRQQHSLGGIEENSLLSRIERQSGDHDPRGTKSVVTPLVHGTPATNVRLPVAA